MNYQHAFHAGNHADVLKHIVLRTLLDALLRKPAAFFVLDTHAGDGRYRLDSDAAEKTGEAQSGIQRLLHWCADAAPLPQALQGYLDAIHIHLEQGYYPGSPLLIADAMRESDRLACCELHPEPATQLRELFAGDRRIGVHQRDGYAATRALLPPPEKRGLVLIDPPYEAQLAEFDIALDALRNGLARWPQGIFALWYPIKLRRNLQPVLREAAALPAKSAYVAELLIRPGDSPLRMNGSGVLLLNPPWKSDDALSEALPHLAAALGERDASWRVEWLRRESEA